MNIKVTLKKHPIVIKVYLMYNVFMNLFFRGNKFSLLGLINKRLKIAVSAKLYNVRIKGGGYVVIGEKSLIRNSIISSLVPKRRIEIGNNCFINGTKLGKNLFSTFEDGDIIIGENSILSNSIEIYTSDYHSVLDSLGCRCNKSKSVMIGNNVWIGLKTVILPSQHQAN